MTNALRIRPQAEADMLETYAWCEDRKPGLGEQFLSGIDDCLDGIRQHPRASLKRFPYSIFYFVHEAEIVILACLHAKRRPGTLRSRL